MKKGAFLLFKEKGWKRIRRLLGFSLKQGFWDLCAQKICPQNPREDNYLLFPYNIIKNSLNIWNITGLVSKKLTEILEIQNHSCSCFWYFWLITMISLGVKIPSLADKMDHYL